MNPLTVYLDQNVFGHMLDSGADWRDDPLAKVLLRDHADSAQCWLSPTHILELIQCSDVARRQKLAGVMLELVGARRMWSGPDFFTVEQFGNFLNSQAPGAFDPAPFFAEYKRLTERLWLGYLGLLAASPVLPLGPGLDEVRLAKAQTKLIHARIATDPDTHIDRILKSVRNFETTDDPDPLGLAGMTLVQIEEEVLQLRAVKARPERKTIERLKKERDSVAAAYGAVDIGAAVQAVFRMPCDLELTFNTPLIVKSWSKIKRQLDA